MTYNLSECLEERVALTEQQNLAAMYIAGDKMAYDAIGKEVGVTRRTLSTWKLEPEFAEPVASIRAKTQILGSFVYHRRGITDALKKPLFTLLSSSQINAFLLPVGIKG
jgi:hypothetical protein